MRKNWKRLIAFVVTAAMLIGVMPAVALGQEGIVCECTYKCTKDSSPDCPICKDQPDLCFATQYKDTDYCGLTIKGGASGTDYTCKNKTVTVLTGTAITISGATTEAKIVVGSGVTANITIDGLNIDVSATESARAFKLDSNATCNLNLSGTNTLKSGNFAAGLEVSKSTTLVINGTGSLESTAGESYAAGIGGSRSQHGGNITILGGTITANGSNATWGGAGIGSGYEDFSGTEAGTIIIEGGTVYANGYSDGAGIGGSGGGSGGNVIIRGGTVVAKSFHGGAGIGGGSGFNFVAGRGDGGTILIEGGTVTAIGASGAGIGGGYERDGGNITITGGTVNASSASYGAGIGGGYKGDGGTINISGGIVTAIGDSFYAAGIGGGYEGDGGNVTISGGTVTAIGSTPGTGIGKGSGGKNAGSFSTGANGNAFIAANSIEDQSNKSAWSGVVIEGVKGYVYGKTVSMTDDAEVQKDHWLEIPEGSELIVPKGVTLTNNGTINRLGKLTVLGKLINNGTLLPESYTVTWTDYDGEILETDTDVMSGTTPTYDGKTPWRDHDSTYDYRFIGWTPKVGPISADTTYTAVYERRFTDMSSLHFTIDYSAETVTAEPGYQVKTEHGSWSNNTISIVPNEYVYVRKSGETDYKQYQLPARPVAPSGFTVVNETVDGWNDGKITGISIGKAPLEYRLQSYTWEEAADSINLENLVDGTYELRFKAHNEVADGCFASEIATATVGKGKPCDEITGVEVEEGIVYDGNTHKGYTGTPTGQYNGEYEIIYDTADGKAPKNVGEYTVTFKVPDSVPDLGGKLTLNFVIAPKELEWDTTDLSASKKEGVSGEAAVTGELKVKGFIEGESFDKPLSDPGELKTSGLAEKTEKGEYTVEVVRADGKDYWFAYADGIYNYKLPAEKPTVIAVIEESDDGGDDNTGGGDDNTGGGDDNTGAGDDNTGGGDDNIGGDDDNTGGDDDNTGGGDDNTGGGDDDNTGGDDGTNGDNGTDGDTSDDAPGFVNPGTSVDFGLRKYAMLFGRDQIVMRGDVAVFISEAEFYKFVKVQVDGLDVMPQNYLSEQGSTKITLKASYIDSLSDGMHRIVIVSSDGYAEAIFTVAGENIFYIEEAPSYNTSIIPNTGDDTNIVLWCALMLAGIIAAVSVLDRKRHIAKKR